MKITEHAPPTPPPSTFTLELTLEQLVGLGVLSFCYESIASDRGTGTFFHSLPKHLQTKVERTSGETKIGTDCSRLAVDWSE